MPGSVFDPDCNCSLAQEGSELFCNESYWSYHNYVTLYVSEWSIVVKTLLIILITGFGLVGNLSIIIIIVKNKLLRLQATNLFLLNMALSDFLLLFFIPFLYYFKPNVIFRLYKLDRIPCRMTPFLIVTFFLSGSLSLMVISLNRMCGIVYPNIHWLRLSRRNVLVILGGIWIVSVAFAGPTIYYRRYWEVRWIDLLETNCDDKVDLTATADPPVWVKCDFKMNYLEYWIINLAVNVWLPTIVMFVSYIGIFFKLKQSIRSFPYLSEQCRIARSRQGVIKMLFVLFLLQVICWGPWQFYTVFDAYVWHTDEKNSVCYDELLAKNTSYDIWSSLPDSDLTNLWQVNEPLLHDIKFYFIFTNSALNPFVYGYCNETMRKAFRITFTCFFKGEPNYVLQRGGAGNAPFSFNKAKGSATNKVGKSIFKIGQTLMAPINANGQQMAYPKDRISRVGQFAKKVIKSTDSFKSGKSSTKNSHKKSRNEVFKMANPHEMTQNGQMSLQSPSKKVSFATIENEGTPKDRKSTGNHLKIPAIQVADKKGKQRKFFRTRYKSENLPSDDDSSSDNSKSRSSIKMSEIAFNKTSVQLTSPSTSITSLGIEMNYEVDIKLNVQVLETPTAQREYSNRLRYRRYSSDPGPSGDFLLI